MTGNYPLEDIMYYGLTIDVKNCRTYWQKAQKSQEKVRQHVERYVHKPCHLIIYCAGYGEKLKFVRHLTNFKSKNRRKIG